MPGRQSLSHHRLLTLYPTLPNGWVLLGELAKIVTVSPVRIIAVDSTSLCPLHLVVRGVPGEQVVMTAVAPNATLAESAVTLQSSSAVLCFEA
eukprot:m.187837 g.187837  ORF g.187837 m.187837 type:complete len:93 (+) comp18170_c0_seq2:862-1140(+)